MSTAADERTGRPDPNGRRDLSSMMVTVGVGLCVVPFVFAVVAWWLGWRVAAGAAVAVTVALALVCWALCNAGAGRPLDRGKQGWPR
jgi:hypothetical protein